ncbi:MAG TPA: energy transducer TonB, partial [Paludibacter sp.]
SKEGPKRLSEQAVLLEQEALRVVNAMPKWTPGEQKGKKVAVYYTLPIKFKLEGGTSVTTTFNGVAAKSSTKISSAIKYDGEAPLYIVDGKEVTESDFNAIKPENIQSINVLKGESATKAYGDKGKNRVVEVKLKK